MTWPALDAQLLADSAATFNFRLGQPVPLAITPAGAVIFRRTPARGFASDLFELDTKTGTVRTLVTAASVMGDGEEKLSDAEKARRERARVATKGIVDADLSTNGETLMFALGDRLHRLNLKSGQRDTSDPAGAVYDPHLSPGGDAIGFVRDGDLWLIDGGGKARALTEHPDGFEYGVADFAAMEELDRRRGFWWSPDGKEILFQRSDNRPIDTLYVADARHPETAPVPFKYPRAGTANAIVDLGVVSTRGDEPVWLVWDRDKYPYLARVTWTAGDPITIVVLSREQTELAVLAFDKPGAPARTLLVEHDDAWVNLTRPTSFAYAASAPLWLPDHSGFLWQTEHEANVLELHAPDGKLVRELTKPELGLRALAGVDGADAIVEASTDPTKRDVWRVPLVGGAPTALTHGEGVSYASVDRGVVVISTALHGGGKRAEVITMSATHMVPDPKLSLAREQVQIDFFREHLR